MRAATVSVYWIVECEKKSPEWGTYSLSSQRTFFAVNGKGIIFDVAQEKLGQTTL